MNKEKFTKNFKTYYIIRDSIKQNLLNKTEELLDEIMPIITHLIEENDELREENRRLIYEKSLNPKTVIHITEDDWKGLQGNNDFEPQSKPEMI